MNSQAIGVEITLAFFFYLCNGSMKQTKVIRLWLNCELGARTVYTIQSLHSVSLTKLDFSFLIPWKILLEYWINYFMTLFLILHCNDATKEIILVRWVKLFVQVNPVIFYHFHKNCIMFIFKSFGNIWWNMKPLND